jgi:hypothetical protein
MIPADPAARRTIGALRQALDVALRVAQESEGQVVQAHFSPS